MSPAPHIGKQWVAATIALVAVALGATGCGQPSPPAAAPNAPTPTGQPPPQQITAEGVLAPPDQATNAFTYDPALAPPGARIAVQAGEADGATQIRMEVQGLQPNRGYAAHAHARACGPTGDAAGPHFQNVVDPAANPQQPSTNPAYANPQNEIWLDLRTDGSGNAEVNAEVPFVFTDRAPASVVIHQHEATATAPGQAGSAGGRVACLDVPFE